MANQAAHAPLMRPVAVLMTLFCRDRLDLFIVALQSIERQDIESPIRIYLCCDGPLTDVQAAWLAENYFRFYRIVHNESNTGLARSLNRLIELLDDEEFVYRMDGDDISDARRFRLQADLMREEPDLSLIGCQAYDIDMQGNISGKRDFPTSCPDIKKALVGANPVLHPAFCIRGTVLTGGARYPNAYLAEDLAFVVTLASAGHQISNHPERLFYWRLSRDFFARRQSFRRGVAEMTWYFRAVRSQGSLFSYKSIFPILRFLMRVAPQGLAQRIYRSRLRDRFILNGR